MFSLGSQKAGVEASDRGDDDHQVGGDVGDAVEEIGGEPGQVALREFARRENMQHVGGLRARRKREGHR